MIKKTVETFTADVVGCSKCLEMQRERETAQVRMRVCVYG